MSAELSHNEIEELLGAYALDAVDGDEREAVERHLAGCPRCESEVREHREVAALLAHAGGAAPEGLWDRIAGNLDGPPPELRLSPVGPPATTGRPVGPDASERPPASVAPVDASDAPRAPVVPLAPRRPWAVRALTAVAAAAAVVIGILGVQVVQQDRRIDDLSVALAENGLVRAYSAALTDPDAAVSELRSDDGSLTATAVVKADGTGFVSGEALPVLSGGRVYQLWGVIGEEVISLGVLGEDPDVVAFQTSPRVALLAITAEDAPVVSSNQPFVVSGKVA